MHPLFEKFQVKVEFTVQIQQVAPYTPIYADIFEWHIHKKSVELNFRDSMTVSVCVGERERVCMRLYVCMCVCMVVCKPDGPRPSWSCGWL